MYIHCTNIRVQRHERMLRRERLPLVVGRGGRRTPVTVIVENRARRAYSGLA